MIIQFWDGLVKLIFRIFSFALPDNGIDQPAKNQPVNRAENDPVGKSPESARGEKPGLRYPGISIFCFNAPFHPAFTRGF